MLRDFELAEIMGLAFAYAAAVLLWIPTAPLLAAGGRMALTNYLTQSFVFSFVFFSYGLGLFGRLTLLPCVIGGAVFYLAQLVLSRWWLRHFYFGPVEWLWRSLTYGKRQSFLQPGEWTISRRTARIMVFVVMLIVVPLVHLGVPWLLARSGTHYGWAGNTSGTLNKLGLVVLACAAGLIIWISATSVHQVRFMPERLHIGLQPPALLQTGPYGKTRHPMYLAEILLWLGVTIYFGSLLVLGIAVLITILAVRFLVPREERALERQFGEGYREYQARVPALIGWKRHRPQQGAREA